MARRSTAADAQGQLSLFDSLSAWFGGTALPTRPAEPALPNPPRAGVKPPPPPAPGRGPIAAPTGQVDDPAASQRFTHPRASREVQLGRCLVAYEFRRTRRRSIGFIVGAEGLSVAAPRWVSFDDVEQALRVKAGWIVGKLAEQRERAERLRAARIDWRDGATVRFLGADVQVVLDPLVTGAVLAADAGSAPSLQLLRVGLARSAAPEQIREAVQSWLQRQARRVFDERGAHFAAILGVRPTRLALSSATRRWGSASADGTIRLNWRLIHFALPVIDYVVTHELAHLREMNHSAAFWDVVRSAMPDFARHRETLVRETVPTIE
jgi:predicted metal-dependent hydrolase